MTVMVLIFDVLLAKSKGRKGREVDLHDDFPELPL